MTNAGVSQRFDTMGRGRRSLAIDLKKDGAVDAVLELVKQADILLEGFRPGVMERIGLGPKVCLQLKPRLVYGRLTGWGQDGPLSQAAGHDINYIALSGVLSGVSKSGEPPIAPMNLLGDFGGGGLLLAFGVLAALYESQKSGAGQVVDAAMAEGASLLATMSWGVRAALKNADNHEQAKTNPYDGSCPYYGSYECADGKHVCIASAEPQFYAQLRKTLGLDDPLFDHQNDMQYWPEQKRVLTQIFKQRTRAEWCEIMEGTDISFAPILDWDEAAKHPHNRARNNFIEVKGVVQPAPAPKFSRTGTDIPRPSVDVGADSESILTDWNVSPELVNSLRKSGAI